MGEHLKKLRELRIAKGISQKELAEYLGITVASYSLYERGNREPNISILKKIAAYYGISVDELLELNEEPQTIAAHFEGDEFTEEELDEIRKFAEFVRSKRKNLQSPPMKTVTTKEVSVHLGTDVSNLLNAAHADDYENAPEELKKKEEDIMDDENF